MAIPQDPNPNGNDIVPPAPVNASFDEEMERLYQKAGLNVAQKVAQKIDVDLAIEGAEERLPHEFEAALANSLEKLRTSDLPADKAAYDVIAERLKGSNAPSALEATVMGDTSATVDFVKLLVDTMPSSVLGEALTEIADAKNPLALNSPRFNLENMINQDPVVAGRIKGLITNALSAEEGAAVDMGKLGDFIDSIAQHPDSLAVILKSDAMEQVIADGGTVNQETIENALINLPLSEKADLMFDIAAAKLEGDPALLTALEGDRTKFQSNLEVALTKSPQLEGLIGAELVSVMQGEEGAQGNALGRLENASEFFAGIAGSRPMETLLTSDPLREFVVERAAEINPETQQPIGLTAAAEEGFKYHMAGQGLMTAMNHDSLGMLGLINSIPGMGGMGNLFGSAITTNSKGDQNQLMKTFGQFMPGENGTNPLTQIMMAFGSSGFGMQALSVLNGQLGTLGGQMTAIGALSSINADYQKVVPGLSIFNSQAEYDEALFTAGRHATNGAWNSDGTANPNYVKEEFRVLKKGEPGYVEPETPTIEIAGMEIPSDIIGNFIGGEQDTPSAQSPDAVVTSFRQDLRKIIAENPDMTTASFQANERLQQFMKDIGIDRELSGNEINKNMPINAQIDTAFEYAQRMKGPLNIPEMAAFSGTHPETQLPMSSEELRNSDQYTKYREQVLAQPDIGTTEHAKVEVSSGTIPS